MDDEPDLLKAIKIRLDQEGYAVVTAEDGLEGLEKAEEEAPALILLDIRMAQMDGHTMLRELKQMDKIKSIPVIIMTAHAEMKDLFAVEGISDYIVKPFDHQDLLLRVSRAPKK